MIPDTKIVFLDYSTVPLLVQLVSMRVSELTIIGENPDIINVYKEIIRQLNR